MPFSRESLQKREMAVLEQNSEYNTNHRAEDLDSLAALLGVWNLPKRLRLVFERVENMSYGFGHRKCFHLRYS